jgi:hypothetical protein
MTAVTASARTRKYDGEFDDVKGEAALPLISSGATILQGVPRATEKIASRRHTLT